MALGLLRHLRPASLFCFAKLVDISDFRCFQHKCENWSAWIRCDPRDELTPSNIFHYSESALRHWCIFRTQNIDFIAKAPDTYLRRSFQTRFMPAKRMYVHSQATKKPIFPPSIERKRKRNNILIAPSLSLAFAIGSFLGLKSLQLCLLKQGMQRSKEGLCQEIIQSSSAVLAMSEKKTPLWDGRKPPSLKTMAMEIFRNFWWHREKSLSRSEFFERMRQAVLDKFKSNAWAYMNEEF